MNIYEIQVLQSLIKLRFKSRQILLVSSVTAFLFKNGDSKLFLSVYDLIIKSPEFDDKSLFSVTLLIMIMNLSREWLF